MIIIFVVLCSIFLSCSENNKQYEHRPLKYRKTCIEESYIPIDIFMSHNKVPVNKGNLFDQIQKSKLTIRWCNAVYGNLPANDSINNFTLSISEKKQLKKVESDTNNHELNQCVTGIFNKINFDKEALNKGDEISIQITWKASNWREYISALNNDDFGKALYYADLTRRNISDLSEYLAIAIQKGKGEVAKKIINKGIYPNDTIGPNRMPLIQCSILNGEKEILKLFLKQGKPLISSEFERYVNNLKENCKKQPDFPADGNGCFPEIIKMLEEYIRKK